MLGAYTELSSSTSIPSLVCSPNTSSESNLGLGNPPSQKSHGSHAATKGWLSVVTLWLFSVWCCVGTTAGYGMGTLPGGDWPVSHAHAGYVSRFSLHFSWDVLTLLLVLVGKTQPTLPSVSQSQEIPLSHRTSNPTATHCVPFNGKQS